jgi:hypothetical protein
LNNQRLMPLALVALVLILIAALLAGWAWDDDAGFAAVALAR